MSSTKADKDITSTSYIRVPENLATSEVACLAASGNKILNEISEEWVDERPSSPSYLTKQFVVGIIGVLLGILTFIPNVMMASMSQVAAHVGIFASLCLTAGGIAGWKTSRTIWLLPGLLLQTCVFLFVFFSSGE